MSHPNKRREFVIDPIPFATGNTPTCGGIFKTSDNITLFMVSKKQDFRNVSTLLIVLEGDDRMDVSILITLLEGVNPLETVLCHLFMNHS